ncbi:TlpA family protein disulfide reductase [sulfur-oxidizing endosymbiont of Gigantopelta aegis]|uniref:TlpA family protein disulfide reductase n=1 Tax=sulfur-oxidizing endosymbiont of Gigantopelta aegis TaxID=2794934 RepID=UPI001BE3FD38|nr:TlpA disulfide reductase family protein [sulfur-oxidizing endosymbiont of Gigantopelta aegis]
MSAANLHAEKIPELSLMGIDDQQHAMSDYIGKGKWVIVNIWGPKCPPCVEEMPELQSFHEDHQNKDAIVVGIAIDYPSFGPGNAQDVREFAEDNFISYPLLLGDTQSSEQLGAGPLSGTPTTLLFTPSGKLEGMQVGAITQKILEDFIASNPVQP